jgi:hypothetical protein
MTMSRNTRGMMIIMDLGMSKEKQSEECTAYD